MDLDTSAAGSTASSLAHLSITEPDTGAHQADAPSTSSTAQDLNPPMSMRQHCFSEATSETTLHFQILDMGRQLYIWAASETPTMSSLHLAIKTPMDPVPSCSSLLTSPATSTGASVAQRLALKVGRPILCSWNIPSNAQLLEVMAERRLLQELKTLNFIPSDSSTRQ